MINKVLFPANGRGHADHGWLKANHSFSFANFYNPELMNFGALRVLNDDYIAGGMGFGAHPHDNMEIITIPLEGSLSHKDSMGNVESIEHGEVQVMSAGTGVRHSEFNHSETDPVKLFQIWIIPNKRDTTPRYDQIRLNLEDRKNKLQQIISPFAEDEGSWIQQDAWMNVTTLDQHKTLEYKLHQPNTNGVYIMVVEGSIKVGEDTLERRDAIGLWNLEAINIESLSDDAYVLFIEVPMEF